MSLSPPLSRITHNGCTRASIGTITNEMLKFVPNFILTKKTFHYTPKKWFYGTLYHSFTFSFNRQETKYFWGVVIFNLFTLVVHFLKMNKCLIIPLVSLEARVCIELCAFSWCWCYCCLCESCYNCPSEWT